jgi:hypothetical protein
MALRVHVRAEVQSDPALFVALAIDLDRIRALHPRVVGARWLDEPAVSGARAEIEVALPPVLTLLLPIVGAPHGVLTLAEHEPGRRVSYRLGPGRVAGGVELAVDRSRPVPAVVVNASLWPASAPARAAMLPVWAVARPVIARSAHLTLLRADAMFSGEAAPRP